MKATMKKLCPIGTEIQTLIFSKEVFNQKTAKDWANKHDFKYGKVDEKENTFRLRQETPTGFKKGTFRTIELRDGVQAVIGCPYKYADGGCVERTSDYDKEIIWHKILDIIGSYKPIKYSTQSSMTIVFDSIEKEDLLQINKMLNGITNCDGAIVGKIDENSIILKFNEKMIEDFVQDEKEKMKAMKKNYADGGTTEELKGRLVRLNKMDDKYPVPANTIGVIDFVDGIGQIHIKWENGSSLALVPEIDDYEIFSDWRANSETKIKRIDANTIEQIIVSDYNTTKIIWDITPEKVVEKEMYVKSDTEDSWHKVSLDKYADGGGVGEFPTKGELTNKDNFLLKYEKKGSDYEFYVYKPITKEVSGYNQIKHSCINKDCPQKMSYRQFVNYLFAELYLDDKKYADGGGVYNIKNVDTKLSLEDVSKIAEETANILGSEFSVTKKSIDIGSFDLDLNGYEYEGGSYAIMTNGDVVNVALRNTPIYYNYKTKDKYADGGLVYIEFLNKEKGFKKDIKNFKSYEEAVKWAKGNFEKFNPDMIKFKMADGGAIESKINLLHKNTKTYEDLSKIKAQVVNDVPKEVDSDSVPEIDIDIVDSMKFDGKGTKISNSKDAYLIFNNLWDKDKIGVHEAMNILFLNKANNVIGYYKHSKGGIDGTVADVEMISALAVKSLAKAVVIAHNHPSGNLTPSNADIQVSKELRDALKLFKIILLDSIIITKDNYKSLADEQLFADGGNIDSERRFSKIDFDKLSNSGQFSSSYNGNGMWVITKVGGGLHLGKFNLAKEYLFILGKNDLSNPLVKWLSENSYADGGGVGEYDISSVLNKVSLSESAKEKLLKDFTEAGYADTSVLFGESPQFLPLKQKIFVTAKNIQEKVVCTYLQASLIAEAMYSIKQEQGHTLGNENPTVYYVKAEETPEPKVPEENFPTEQAISKTSFKLNMAVLKQNISNMLQEPSLIVSGAMTTPTNYVFNIIGDKKAVNRVSGRLRTMGFRVEKTGVAGNIELFVPKDRAGEFETATPIKMPTPMETIVERPIGNYLSNHKEMFNDEGVKLSKSDVYEFLKLSENSNFKYWVKDKNGYSYYIYKGQLRANDSTSGIFKATKIDLDKIKDDSFPVKIKEEQLYDWEKELDPNKKRVGWEAIIYKFGEVYFSEGADDNELVSDQVKAEEYKWQFDRYSNYASPLSWADAEDKFKKSLTAEELDSIEISYKKEEYGDLEEHDTEKYHKQIFVRRKQKKDETPIVVETPIEIAKDIVTDEVESIKEAIEYLQMEADSGDEEAIEALSYLQDELKNLIESSKTDKMADGGEILIGGKADYMSLGDIAEMHKVSLDHILRQAQIGKKIELEHTSDYNKAIEIVKDHLYESPYYYTKLKKMEKSFDKSKFYGGGLTTKKYKNDFDYNLDSQSVSCFINCKNTGRTLILKRANSDFEGTWSLISGGMESNELPDETIKREIQEELGIKLDFSNLIYLDSNKNPQGTHHYYEMSVDEEFEPTLNQENQSYKWVNMGGFPSNTHPLLIKYLKSHIYA